MTLTRDEILSALFGYAVWLAIAVYLLIYRPVQRVIK